MLPCKVHNVGFYAPEPRGIYVMAIERNSNKLAVSRSDASIEIWNLTHLPFIERSIPSSLDNFSVEGLCWFADRLFSVGIHGFLVEYDLYKLSIKDKWVVTGEAAMCLDICQSTSRIAVGTEQGYINMFSIEQPGAQFEKFLDKQEGRIICIKFSADGEYLVTGSINAIRIWNVNTGHAIHKMQLGRSEAKKDTIVWCLEVLSDFTIFSGDSRGVLTLWDGKMGSHIQNYQSHKADITALCVSAEQDQIYCAGIDPLITNYEKVKVGQVFKWVRSIQRKIHDHDIRALVYHEKKLYSAGIDSYLACSYHPPKTLIKYPAIMQNPCVDLAPESKLILLRYPKQVEVWSLGETQKTENNYTGTVQLKSAPVKLVMIQCIGNNWENDVEEEAIISAAISGDGQWIFIATKPEFRLYQLDLSKNKLKLTRIDDLDDSKKSSLLGVFNNKHKQLIVYLDDGQIVIYNLDDGTPFISETIAQDKKLLEDTVTHLMVSPCGKYLVAGDPKGNIVIWNRHKDGYAFRTKLPKVPSSPTALGINSITSCLVVVYADSKIVEYNIKIKAFSSRSRTLERHLPQSWKTRTYPVRSVTFDPRKPDVIVLGDDSTLTIITDKVTEGKRKESTPAKIRKQSLVNGSTEIQKVRTIQKFKHLVHFAYLRDDELVVVETNPLSLLKKLPPAFAQKTFAT